MIISKIQTAYPSFFEESLLKEMEQFGRVNTFEANDIIIDVDEMVKDVPLLIDGAIKVMREDFNKGELLLYFLEKGDTCAMTMNCCLSNKRSKIRAVAETKGILIMLPLEKMDVWMAHYKSWRSFILDSYNSRLDEMLYTIDNIAFTDTTNRLKKYLLDVASINKSHVVNKTHQEIAYELNSSRVVISRLLKVLEKENYLSLNRNVITII